MLSLRSSKEDCQAVLDDLLPKMQDGENLWDSQQTDFGIAWMVVKRYTDEISKEDKIMLDNLNHEHNKRVGNVWGSYDLWEKERTSISLSRLAKSVYSLQEQTAIIGYEARRFCDKVRSKLNMADYNETT